MAQLFFIQSGSGAGAAIWGGSTSLGRTEAAGDAVTVTRGDPATNGRFRFGPRDNEGRFAIYTPTGRFVVTVDAGGDVILGRPSPGDTRQLWRWDKGGRLINGEAGRAAALLKASQGDKLSTRALADGDPTQIWSIFASGPPDNSPFSLYNSVSESGNYQVASIAYETLAPGSSLYLQSLTAFSHGQLWFYTSSGTIVCVEDPGLLLTATSTGQVFVAAPLTSPANPAFQQWRFTEGALTCVATGQALTVAAPLGAEALTSPLAANQSWSWTPGYLLTTILNQSASGFEPFTGDQAAAYNSINAQLEPDIPGFDVREQYSNTGAPLTGWIAQIGTFQPPAGVSENDWEAVTGQIVVELTYAASIQSLFLQYQDFHSDAFENNISSLIAIGNDLSVSSSANVNTTGTALLEGVIYTVLSALPEIGGILGNLFETGFNAAVANGAVSPASFAVVYNELWGNLTPGFVAVLKELGLQETAILSNWNMMEPVATAILSSGPNSLAWPPTNTAAYVSAATQGYCLAALQMLIPTQQIWVARCGGLPTSAPPVNNAPAAASWGYQDYFANVFFVAATSYDGTIGPPDNFTYPSSAVIADVTNNGGRVSDFYPGRAGWNVNVVDGWLSAGETFNGFGYWQYDTLLTTIVNMSDRTLSVALKAEEGSVAVIGNSTQTVGPYGVLDFASDHSNGLRIDVTVTDQETGVGQAFFKLHLEIDEDPFTTPPPSVESIWVDSQSTSNGFAIGDAVIRPWAGDTSGIGYTCGSVTVPVFFTPAGLEEQARRRQVGRGASSAGA